MAYGYPVLLDFTGGNQTRPDKPHKTWLVAELKQVIAEYPAKSALLGMSAGEFKVKGQATYKLSYRRRPVSSGFCRASIA